MSSFYSTMPDEAFRIWYNALSDFDKRSYFAIWQDLLKTDLPAQAHSLARSELLFDPEGVL